MNTEYLHDVMTGQGISNKATHLIRKIKESGVDFDAIAFRGMSGALISPVVAARLNKKVIVCRKTTDNSHSSYETEANFSDIKRYIIIDDFMETGKTIRVILNQVRRANMTKSGRGRSKCVGVFLYLNKQQRRSINKIPIYSV